MILILPVIIILPDILYNIIKSLYFPSVLDIINNKWETIYKQTDNFQNVLLDSPFQPKKKYSNENESLQSPINIINIKENKSKLPLYVNRVITNSDKVSKNSNNLHLIENQVKENKKDDNIKEVTIEKLGIIDNIIEVYNNDFINRPNKD